MCVPSHHTKGGRGTTGFNLLLKCKPILDWDRISWFLMSAELRSRGCSNQAFYRAHSSLGCQWAALVVNVDIARTRSQCPLGHWWPVTRRASLSQGEALHIWGSDGSGQLVHTQAIRPDSHFFLQGTRREQKVPNWPRHGRNCTGKRRESGEMAFLLFVQPSLCPARVASGSPGPATMGFGRSRGVER